MCSPKYCQFFIFIWWVLKKMVIFIIYIFSSYVKLKNILLGVNCWKIAISEWGKTKQIHNHEQEKSFKFVISYIYIYFIYIRPNTLPLLISVNAKVWKQTALSLQTYHAVKRLRSIELDSFYHRPDNMQILYMQHKHAYNFTIFFNRLFIRLIFFPC